MYEPQPIETDDIILSEDILALADILARNTHEVWALGRINEGWTYGEKRDDTLKQTPCLVPYEQLSDIEKSYDFNTSIETLKLIVKLGYKITKQ